MELVGMSGICVYVMELPSLPVVVTIMSPLRVVLPPPITYPGAGQTPAGPQLVIVVVANIVVVPVPGLGVQTPRVDWIMVAVAIDDGMMVLP